MADITPTHKQVGRHAHLYLWETLTESDTALPVSVPFSADRSVHVVGTFGGATITMQGTNETAPTNYETLTNIDGTTACTFTAAALQQIEENTVWIRPSSASGSSSDVDVYLLVKG